MALSRSRLSTATALALMALASSCVAAEEGPSTIWSARHSSLRVQSDLGDVLPILNPLGAPSEPAKISGVRFDANGRISLSAGLGSDTPNESLATLPWCAEASGLLRIGSLGRDCLMQGTVQMELPGRVATAAAGAQWRGERFDLSLAYGYSWWAPNTQPLNAPYAPAPELNLLPTATTNASLPGWTGNAQTIGMQSQWRLTAESAVQLNAALQELRLRSGTAKPVLDLQQVMLGVGMSYGTFSGNITGRVDRVNDQAGYPNRYWRGVDVGVSWRTPWAGELTVGARNVVGKSNDRSREPVIDETSARTPYVRYKQDL